MTKKVGMAGLLLVALSVLTSGCSTQQSGDSGTTQEQTTQQEQTSQENQEQTDSSSQEDTAAQEAAYEQLKEKLLAEGEGFPQLEMPEEGEEIAVITTNYGEIKIKFCPEQAPKAVENFISLAKEGYYDGITFHRVVNDFMIQGGDPMGTGAGGESIWGEDFDDELSPDLYHFRGAVAMANSGPNTNGSQFYIVQKNAIEDGYFEYMDQVIETYGDSELLYNATTGGMIRFNYRDDAKEKYNELGGTPELDYGYTIFGQVFEGMDVVDAIAAVEVQDSGSGEMSQPVEDVVMEKVEIVPYSAE